MPDRKSPHSDKSLIDDLEPVGEAQQSRAGGTVAKDVGTRAELNRATDPEDTERPRGSDNPAQDEAKGQKTRDAIRSGRQG